MKKALVKKSSSGVPFDTQSKGRKEFAVMTGGTATAQSRPSSQFSNRKGGPDYTACQAGYK